MPALVEFVGLPGSGKSTAFETLLARDASLQPMPILRHGPHRGTLLRELARTLGTFVRCRALRFDREMLVMGAYLDALPVALADVRGTVVFDQGPIYTLCRPFLRQPRLRRWRDAKAERWRGLLDVVVWLDAPDEVLLERIDGRDKEHRLKGSERAAAQAELVRERAVHLQALERFPNVLRFDTSEASPDAVADAVLEVLA